MAWEVSHRATYSMEAAKLWLDSYCSGLIHRIGQKKDNRQKNMIDKVLGHIQENYLRTDISVEMLSDMVSLTPGYFGKIFSDFVGKSVNDIAAQVGFSNQSYFTATFRKWNGITQNQYRSELKKTL